jgi:hypothetical protein
MRRIGQLVMITAFAPGRSLDTLTVLNFWLGPAHRVMPCGRCDLVSRACPEIFQSAEANKLYSRCPTRHWPSHTPAGHSFGPSRTHQHSRTCQEQAIAIQKGVLRRAHTFHGPGSICNDARCTISGSVNFPLHLDATC